MRNFLLFFAVAAALLLAGCGDRPGERVAETIKEAGHFHPVQKSVEGMTVRHTVYVPAYSHIYTSKDMYEELGITLSVRNTDPERRLLVEKILYYNTEGSLVETFLSEPHVLDPMGTIDFVVNLQDMRGGSGANFTVEWAGESELFLPVIQAVMVNVSGAKAFAFATDGVTVK